MSIAGFALASVGKVQDAAAAVAGWIAGNKAVAGVAGVLSLAAGGLIAWAVWFNEPAPPPPIESSTPTQIGEYLASDDFRNLSDERKLAFLEGLRESDGDRSGRPGRLGRPPLEGISEEQHEKIRENISPVFREMMRKEMNAFFTLSPEEKNAFLDKRIDQMEEFRRRRSEEKDDAPPGEDPQEKKRPEGDRRRGLGPSVEHLKKMIEKTPPEDRARFQEFVKAMHKRMEQRGVEPPRFGPPPH
jgi:hypothetical protein